MQMSLWPFTRNQIMMFIINMEIQCQAVKRREDIRKHLKHLKIVPSGRQEMLARLDNPEANNVQKTQKNWQKKGEIKLMEDVFEKKFQIREKLGEGVQSVVRRAVSKANGKSFAVKIMKNMDQQKIYHTKHEFKIVQTIDLPTIVKVHEMYVSPVEAQCRIIMEYCEMPQLRKVLSQFERLNEDLVSEIIKTLLETVQFLHSRGICHRDIKPQNILYCINTGDLKLLDFNIATLCSRQMMSVTGTIFYKAPQMFEGSYTNKVDIWAIGIITYELIHGRLPFQHENINNTIQKICQTDIESLLNQDLSTFTKDFLKKCLMKDPRQRLTAKQALKEPFILSASKKSPLTPSVSDFHNNSFDCETQQQTKQPDEKQGFSSEMKNRCRKPSIVMTEDKESFYMDKVLGINTICAKTVGDVSSQDII